MTYHSKRHGAVVGGAEVPLRFNLDIENCIRIGPPSGLETTERRMVNRLPVKMESEILAVSRSAIVRVT